MRYLPFPIIWWKVEMFLPQNTNMVEIAAFNQVYGFWHLSHAWYDGKQWIRYGGEKWEIEFWRESEFALDQEKPWQQSMEQE